MRRYFYFILYFFSDLYLFFTSRRLRVIAYHDITNPQYFDSQIKYLKHNYNLIDIQVVKDHIIRNKQIPRKSLLITFDDGDLTVLKQGLPILQKYRIPAVLFVITDLINSNKPYWWDEINQYIGNENGNQKVWDVKTWKNKEREQYLTDIRIANEDNLIFKDQLSLTQLKELQDGGVMIANHSHTHPMFDKCEEDEIKKELESSYSILHSLGFFYNVFAYPNGNFDKISERILKEKKIELAFLFDHKINPVNINPLRISRIRVNADTDLREFKVKVSGLHSLIYNRIK